MSKKTLKITQGALMTAIFGVLVFLNRQTAGFAEQVLVYVYPLPIAVYCARYGFKAGFPAAAAMALLAFLLGSLNYAFYASTSLLIGYVCGGCIARGFSAKKTLAVMIVIGVMVNLADIFVISKISGITFMDEIAELQDMGSLLQESLTGVLSGTDGKTNPFAASFSTTYEAIFSVEFLKKFLIAATILTGILQAFLIYMFSTIIMRRLKIRVPKMALRGKLHIPVWVGYAAGALLLAAYVFFRYRSLQAASAGKILDLTSLDSLENIALAVYMAGLWFLIIAGIGPAARLIYRLTGSRPFAVILTVLGVLFLGPAVALIGFLDLIRLPDKIGLKGSGRDEKAYPVENIKKLKGVTQMQLTDPDRIDYLMLVNPWHPLPEGFDTAIEPYLETYHSPYRNKEVRLEKRTMQAALDMQAAMHRDGIDIDFCDGFRSVRKQEEVMEKMIAEYGEEYARSFVAVPGRSEHHTGLALDVFLVIDGKVITDRAVYLKETERWAKVHEYLTAYGFILRYPEGKRDVTGIIYEPWHFRFVGKEAAARIAAEGVTLEEYLGQQPGRA